MLRTIFWAVPALRRVEPATTSGPVTTAMAWSASVEDRAPDVVRDADRERATLAALPRAPRRRTASGRSRPRRRPHRLEPTPRRRRPPRRVDIVLGALDARRQRRAAARHEGRHERRRDAERGHALDRVEHREAAARAGTHVDEPAAPPSRADDARRRRGRSPAAPPARRRGRVASASFMSADDGEASSRSSSAKRGSSASVAQVIDVRSSERAGRPGVIEPTTSGAWPRSARAACPVRPCHVS